MKYQLNGGHRHLQALPVNCDKTSFLAADYVKYVDLIGEMVLSLMREGRNQNLISMHSVFRLDQDLFRRNPFQFIIH
jgi:hypothetical protein